MRTILNHLDFQAIFLALLGGYSIPILLACTMNPSAWSLWFWVLTPLISGYLVAKLAAKIPLMHGLATSFFGLLIIGVLAHPNGVGKWLVIFIINVTFTILGTWAWRRYDKRAI